MHYGKFYDLRACDLRLREMAAIKRQRTTQKKIYTKEDVKK